MLRSIFCKFASDYALDLGTATTLLYVQGVGVIAAEPSFVSVRQSGPRAGEVEAYGSAAKELWGKTSGRLQTMSPMRGGSVSDSTLARDLVRYFVRKIPPQNRLLTSRVLIGVPNDATQLERRAMREATEGGVSANLYLVRAMMAAALGAGLPLDEARGSMIVDIGAGSVRAATVSLGGIVYAGSVQSGGACLDQRIQDYVRRSRGVEIGEATAEELKVRIGSVVPTKRNPSAIVQGRDLRSGLPTTITITQEELVPSLVEPMREMVDLIMTVIECTPPDIACDVAERGVVLSGGGALLRNIDRYLYERVKIPISIAERPAAAVVHGSGKILEQWERYGHLASKGV